MIWRRLLSAFTPGVRVMIAVITACYAAALIGRPLGFDLYSWLGLSSRAFWSGGLWRVGSYALLPGGWFEFLINGFMLVSMGMFLERFWTKKELWVYCVICAVGAGVAKVVLQPSSPAMMVGSAGIVLGLVIAWGRMFPSERMLLMGMWEMSVRTLAIVLGIATLLLMVPCGGIVNALVALFGGLSGWLFLTLRWKISRNRPCAVVNSERIGRLEL
jgi:membrane associated rhomboid family serine protease